MEPDYKITDFKGDIEPGSKGDDVAKIQRILQFLGFGKSIDPQEIADKTFGATSQAAANAWKASLEKNPILKAIEEVLLQIVFHIDKEDLDPELQRGNSHGIKQYRDANSKEIGTLEASVFGAQGSTSRIVNMANKFVGIRETGNNGGAADVFTGQHGVTWCGGFVNYVMDHSVGAGVYDQKDFLSAQSFMREGKAHNVFHNPQDLSHARAGDVIVFTRGGGGKGHVGIVTGIASDGTLTYVSGNDGNAVRERTFDIHHPPKSLLGYTDTQALAASKNISVTRDEPMAVNNASLRIARHSDNAVLRG